MNIYLVAVTFFVAVCTASIGIVVLLRNHHSGLAKSLAVLSIFSAGWMVANIFSNDISLSISALLLVNRLVFVSSGFAMTMLAVFVYQYVERHKKNFIFFHSLIGTVVSLGSFSSLIVTSVTPEQPVTEIVFGNVSIVYFGWLLYCLMVSVVLLARGLWTLGVAKRNKIQFIGWVMVLTFVGAFVCNALLPYVWGVYGASLFGPLFFGVMSGAFAYSISRQRLFDVKVTILYVAGYVLTLLGMGALYSGVIFNILKTLFPSPGAQNVVVVLAIFVLTISFGVLRKAVDRLLLRIFKTERFNMQQAVDDLSKTLQTNINMQPIVDESSNVILKHLGAQKVVCLVFDVDNKAHIWTNEVGKSPYSGTTLSSLMSHQAFLVVDDTQDELGIRKLRSQGVSIVSSILTVRGVIGYLIIYQKANGSVYSSRQLGFLRIAVRSLEVAVNNALSFEKTLIFNETLKAEIKKATLKLKHTNTELETVSRSKDEFISMATHQIRPQMSAIRGFIDMLSKTKINTEQRDLLQWARTGTERSIRIVASMLNLTQYSSGKLMLNTQRVDLADMISNEIEGICSAEPSMIKRIVNKTIITRATVLADEIKLREVIANFCYNAAQYSPKDSLIEVVLESSQKSWVVSVRDYGMGVLPEEADKLFSRFYRTHEAKSRRPTGTGVGLFFAKTIIEAHGGRVFYKPMKKGSTFGFEIGSSTQVG